MPTQNMQRGDMEVKEILLLKFKTQQFELAKKLLKNAVYCENK